MDVPIDHADRRNDRATLLADVATRLLMADRPEEIVSDIFSRLAEHLAVDVFLNYLVEVPGALLRLASYVGVTDYEAKALAFVPFGEAVCGKVAQREQSIVVEGVQQRDDPMVELVRALGVRAYACHPLRGRRGLIGTLSVGSRVRDRFDEEELMLMATVANQAAVAIERSRLEDERARVADDQARQRDFLQQLMDNLPVAVAVTEGPDLRYALANLAYRSLTGDFGTPVVGRTVAEVFPEIIAQGSERRLRQVLETGEPVHLPEIAMEVRGQKSWWSLHNLPLGNSACPTGVLTILSDITGQVRVRDALRESDRRKDEFIAMLSHELRNPLAPIRYALPQIEQAPLDDRATRALAVVTRQVNHMVRLVDDLLDVSRITRGKVELRREIVTLESVVNSAVEAASPLILAARHALNVLMPDDAVWLDADPHRLSQVLTNLLTNAAKYTARGGRITIEARHEAEFAVVRVRDNGMGIPRHDLPRVFDMFQQASRVDRSQGGLGIGLALAKRLIDMHGGTISASSEGPGKGAEFIVRLPLGTARRQEIAGDGQPGTTQGKRLKVLIVDDNADLVEMLAALVGGMGHAVRKALDGQSAVSAALSYLPDVILLDIGLPVMSGLAVARYLRRQPSLAHTRLVALTGWGQAEDQRQTKEAGFDWHLTKPADAQTLQRVLAEAARP